MNSQKKSLRIAFFLALFQLCMLTGIQAQTKSIEVQSRPLVVPILKGVSQNPVRHLVVDIPPSEAGSQLQVIECEMDKESVQLTDRVEIWQTDTASFDKPRSILSMPASRRMNLAVNHMLQPGRNHFWISILPSAKAQLGSQIHIRCLSASIQAASGSGAAQGSSGKLYQASLDQPQQKHRVGIAIRKAGENAVHTYRIPGIVATDKGTLLAVYDIRYNNSRDLPENIDVGLNRSTDGGRTWSPMQIIMDMGAPHENNGIGDPAILFDPVRKRIWVAALWSKGNHSIAGSKPGLSPDTTGQFVLAYSDDDGLSWSAPFSITPQVKDPVWHLFFQGPGNGIAMQDGKLVFAAQYWDEKRMPYSTIIYSDDHGVSWKGSIRGPKSNTTESQVVETVPGMLMLNMRDNRGQYRSVAITKDLGASWTEHPTSRSALPDPVCMGSLIKATLKQGGKARDWLLFSNPRSAKGRVDMTIQASGDMGETWPESYRLLVDERRCYGYSSLVRIDDQRIGLLYEGSGDLYFISIPAEEIFKK